MFKLQIYERRRLVILPSYQIQESPAIAGNPRDLSKNNKANNGTDDVAQMIA